MKHIHLDTVDSTNTYVKELLRHDPSYAAAPFYVTADCQTAGRGRTGHTFSSLRGNGVYLTLCMPLQMEFSDAVFATIAAGASLCGCLREFYPENENDLKIKWVNDIYLGEKKLCGILTEAFSFEPGSGIQCAIVGMGVNLGTDVSILPGELKEKAAGLPMPPVSKENLYAVMANHVYEGICLSFSGNKGRDRILSQYREMSMLTGRTVYFTENDKSISGRVSGIGDGGELILETAEGMRRLIAGEISLTKF